MYDHDDELMHYGTPRHSGRYPWGSGDNPYQRNASFLGYVDSLRKKGLKETEIAKGMDMNTKQLRAKISIATSEKREYERQEAIRLIDKGYSKSAAARRLGIPESTLRGYLNPVLAERANATKKNADILKEAVAKNKYIDVSSGTEHMLGITKDKLGKTLALLQEEGYEVRKIKFEQLGTGNETTMNVLCPPGTSWHEVNSHKGEIKLVQDVYSEDGVTLRKVEPPISIDPSRVYIRYAEDGGGTKDGLIELRRGKEDISLKDANYAQVRIAVNGTHYLKGMAMHTDMDDIPPQYDIVFNTSKSKDVPAMGPKDNTVLKPLKSDPTNPFGATIKSFDEDLIRAQRHYIDADGKEQQSALNIVSEEGNWNTWSKSLASQFLSKQSTALAKKQLGISYSFAKEEFDEINSLTNPVVKASLMEKFASQCDSDATHLQAAALPRQATKVLLPFDSLKENEIYAPHLDDGEEVYLVRYPHGGIFEIPHLVVNNHNKDCVKAIGTNPIDAVGINSVAAARLSGADFDGDTALVIPAASAKIQTHLPLKGLKDFDHMNLYKKYDGMHIMTPQEKQKEMGIVSNLITDMTIKGATWDEIGQAVRHSMVVIDAEKHELNYKQSEIDNNIQALKDKYQAKPDRPNGGGASTLLSRSTSKVYEEDFKEKPYYKMTETEKERWKNGELIFEKTGRTKSKATKVGDDEYEWDKVLATKKVARMQLVSDAYDLASRDENGNPRRMEIIYADYANQMKALANKARSVARSDNDLKYDPNAAKVYSDTVKELKAKIMLCEKEDPLERQAQLIANERIRILKWDNPALRDDRDKLKKLKGLELSNARKQVRGGRERYRLEVTDKDWQAISAGAVSKTTLKKVMRYADDTRIRELATPRPKNTLSPARIALARSWLSNGYYQKDVADMLGISTSTLIKALDGK